LTTLSAPCVGPLRRPLWRPDSVTQRWVALRDRIGLRSIRLHDLRHFQATMLLKAGVPVKNVSSRRATPASCSTPRSGPDPPEREGGKVIR
jgi:integrase